MLAELKEAGAKGLVDTTQAAQQCNTKALLHTNGKYILPSFAPYEGWQMERK